MKNQKINKKILILRKNSKKVKKMYKKVIKNRIKEILRI